MASWDLDVVFAALAKPLYEGGFVGSDYFHEEGG
jgi:hypothetical protein